MFQSFSAIFGVSGTGTRLDANPTESGENVARISVVLAGGAGGELEARETERSDMAGCRPQWAASCAGKGRWTRRGWSRSG